MRWMRLSAVGLGLMLVAAGCVNDSGGGGAAGGGDFPSRTLRIMAPASPGGGWDQTSRAAQQVLEQGVVDTGVEVFNVPQAGGTVGLAQLVNEKGNGHLLMTMGLVMVGAIQTNKSQVTLDQTTPIARLTSEAEAIVVPAKSRYQTLDDLVAAFKANPGKVSIAGGSAGGTDQILAGLVAKAVGVEPSKVNYIAYSGGGEALAAILGGKVAAGISGVGEFSDQIEAGKLRALAVSGAERVEGLDAPTLKEAGVDVELVNWRGMVAPPELSDSDRDGLTRVVTEMHDSQGWKDALAKNGWEDSFLVGEEFKRFLAEEQSRINTVLADLGLVG
jgi:putative tricarboxylic transport membrane protein